MENADNEHSSCLPIHALEVATSQDTERCTDKKEKTNKKRVHHIASRYLQAATSSSGKRTPRNSEIGSSARSSLDLKPGMTIRKALFKGLPSTPVRNPDIPKQNLKIKKPQQSNVTTTTGPMVVLPSGSEETDTTSSVDQEEMQLLMSHHVAAKFVSAKMKRSLDMISSDAPKKLWLLKGVNEKILEKNTSLEVESIKMNSVLLLKRHLESQQAMQCNLFDNLTRLSKKSSEIADSLDACLHYLLLRNVQVPEDLGKIRAAVDNLNNSLDTTLFRISSSQNQLEKLSTILLHAKIELGTQVETISRWREFLEEVRELSGLLTYHMVKEIQEKPLMSHSKLCEFDFLKGF